MPLLAYVIHHWLLLFVQLVKGARTSCVAGSLPSSSEGIVVGRD